MLLGVALSHPEGSRCLPGVSPGRGYFTLSPLASLACRAILDFGEGGRSPMHAQVSPLFSPKRSRVLLLLAAAALRQLHTKTN